MFVCMLYILSNLFLIYIMRKSHKYVRIYVEVVASVLKIKGDLKEAFGVFIMFLKNVC